MDFIIHLQIQNITVLIIQDIFDKIKIFCEKILDYFIICAIMITNERFIVKIAEQDKELF